MDSLDEIRLEQERAIQRQALQRERENRMEQTQIDAEFRIALLKKIELLELRVRKLEHLQEMRMVREAIKRVAEHNAGRI